jgi:hypothetical protein
MSGGQARLRQGRGELEATMAQRRGCRFHREALEEGGTIGTGPEKRAFRRLHGCYTWAWQLFVSARCGAMRRERGCLRE